MRTKKMKFLFTPAKKIFFVCVILLFFILLAFFVVRGERYGMEQPYAEREITFPVMGTVAYLKIQGERGVKKEKLYEVLLQMQQEIRALEKECNIYDPCTPLSLLNKNAAHSPVSVSGHLWKLLEISRKYHQFSGGAFDISITPLMKVWGFYRKRNLLPKEEEIRESRKFVGLEKILFDDVEKKVRFPSPGFHLDLGGIAKGYALDLARKVAEKNGVYRGVLDLGGNIVTLSLPFHGRLFYRIGIKDPGNKEKLLAVIRMPPGKAIATSGSYERFRKIEGKHFSHIIDPLSGYPVSGSLSASILTEKGVDSDALSTTLFIRGEGFMEKIAEAFPGTELLYFRWEGKKWKGFSCGKTFAGVKKVF